MRKSLSIFGWKAILRNYGWTSFWLDSILPLIVSLGLCILMYVKDAAIEEPNTVNYPVYFLVCYLLVYSVSILIGIVIDIFNSGQTTLLDDNSNAE